MKIKINRNIFWTTLLTDFLVRRGIKYACISPGSRSTPLTFAIATEKRIKSFPIVDERTSGFFALGIAKSINAPVVVVTTSGTATAELYPAIIEAYQSRVPLIICTADRPAYLRNTGANQTINQKNIYKNHIRYSADLQLPSLDKSALKNFIRTLDEAISSAMIEKSPVHLNFQFEKPFEPDSTTDEIDSRLISFANSLVENSSVLNEYPLNGKEIFSDIESIDLITIGAGRFDKQSKTLLNKLSLKFNIPIFADANSGLRFNDKTFPNLIHNYEAIVRNEKLAQRFIPKTVLHFGRNLTSQNLEQYIIKSRAKRIIVNESGDRFDTTRKARIVKAEPNYFISKIISSDVRKSSFEMLNFLKDTDKEIESIKNKIFKSSLNEVNIILKLLELIPPDSNLFIGNSLPVRDLDFFAPAIEKRINVYQNRGASGIDGIISTALGIAHSSKQKTFLVIGDLSFYYDLNSLLIAKQYYIPLKIILINNNGGRIFEYLPVSKQKKIFNKYFITSLNLNYKKVADSFGISHKLIKSLSSFRKELLNSNKSKSCLILEVRIDSLFTKSLKDKFWNETKKLLM